MLNEDLIEAIALAHDLGQPPFGPTGERALDDLLSGRRDGRGGPGLDDLGGFSAAWQGLRVVDLLEKRYDHPGLNLTDAFCGFKAYRAEALAKLHITETAWGMPLQLWVQAAALGLRIREVGVPRLYLDPNRAFGGVLDNAEERLAYYRRVITEALAESCGGRWHAGSQLEECRWQRGTCR